MSLLKQMLLLSRRERGSSEEASSKSVNEVSGEIVDEFAYYFTGEASLERGRKTDEAPSRSGRRKKIAFLIAKSAK